MNWRQLVLYALMAIAIVVSFIALYYLGRRGSLYIALVPVILSPVCILLLRLTMEFGQPTGVMNLQSQSWAFLFGDLLALPFAFAMSALSWRSLASDHDAWYQQAWWLIVCICVGLAIAYGFHFVLDGPNYVKAGLEGALTSPTKLWHDIVVYPVLAAGLAYLGVPALKEDFLGTGKFALLGLIVWAALGLADNTLHKLTLSDLHPDVNKTWVAQQR